MGFGIKLCEMALRGGKKITFQLNTIANKSGKVRFSPVAGIHQEGVKGALKQTELQKFILKQMGKGVLLSKVDGFFPAMTLAAGVGAGIGYLLGGLGSDDDKTQGLVVEKEKQHNLNPTQQDLPVATITQTKEKQYVPIKTGGTSWAEIVKSHYPGLVEKCNGNLYGKDGAIRKLKEALAENGQPDLINATDIPKTLNLPLEIDGVKVNDKATAKQVSIPQKGGHTDIKEAGAKNEKTMYNIRDNEKGTEFKWHDKDAGVDSLKVRTGVKEYKLDYAS